MAVRLWGSKTPGNAQDTRDITLMRNKKRVCIPISTAHSIQRRKLEIKIKNQ